jgi:hypothetical protein
LHVTFNQRYKIADSDLYILHLQRYAIDDDGLSFKITDDEPKTESIMGPYRSTKSDRENTIDVDGTVEEETRIRIIRMMPMQMHQTFTWASPGTFGNYGPAQRSGSLLDFHSLDSLVRGPQ